jgi:hypothetical protein
MEAFRGRGKNDFMASHDLEDFVAVIDGRSTIVAEIAQAPLDLRLYLADAARRLLSFCIDIATIVQSYCD